MRPTPLKNCALGLTILLLSVDPFASPYAHSFAQEPAKSMDSDPAPKKHAHTNHLVNETSPYLLQHAHNPVNWYPWGEEAFAKAKREDKPIFLSVGYSTCYWCHVMEVESFESEEVAEVLNEFFVPIKVDREERPDIDEQYMMATQLMTRRGGWPNSVWLMPDGRPWMAGTYFPKQRFIGYLKQTAEIWKTQRDVVEKQATALVEATTEMNAPPPVQAVDPSNDLLDAAATQFINAFDQTNGGFGTAPKFPPHGTLALLIEHYRSTKDPVTLNVITRTLDAMWLGGVHDHVGGGFHRYATDAEWLLPHFEKMLYDNAQLMRLYSEAYELTEKPLYRQAVADIFAWLKREMMSPEGAFYSALDSGEVGQEGEAYIWSMKQLNEAVAPDEADRFSEAYGFAEEGNFKEESTGKRIGKNIPHLRKALPQDDQLTAIRAKLLAHRLTWPQPHRDDKILVSWNGLMIDALAHAGAVLDEPEYTRAAAGAADFILQSMTRDGRLLRTYRDGTAKIDGYLDDYAYLISGLLELHRTTGQTRWLDQAVALADIMLDEFDDPDGGGFYFTGDTHERLIVRSKNLSGGGNLPNANGIAALTLIQISERTDDDRYAIAAKKTLQALSGVMIAQPQSSEPLLIAVSRLDQDNDDAPVPASPDPQTVRVAPVTVTANLAGGPYQAGGQADLVIKLKIDQGWHLYADNPDVDYVVATKVRVSGADDAISVKSIDNSETEVMKDPVLKQSIQTYRENCEFRIKLLIDGDAEPGETPLNVTVDFQACDDTRCLQPAQASVSIPLAIVP